MVSNAHWRKPVSEFAQMTRQWLIMPDGDSLMNLAIFMDAHAVCGDAHLLEAVQRGLMKLATDNDAMLGAVRGGHRRLWQQHRLVEPVAGPR
jgi:CBS domain-containing protein